MLTDAEKKEIRGELFRGCPDALLERARQTDSPPFYRTIAFMLEELRRYHEVPPSKNCVFYIRFDSRFGPVSTCGDWYDGGYSSIQFEGNATRYPDAPLPERLTAPAATFLGIQFKPRRETRRAAIPVSARPDGKSLQAGERD